VTLNQLIQYLTKLAANARSAHVRRVAPFIALIGEGVKQLGDVRFQLRYVRQVLLVVGKRRIVASYRHPKQSPRQRGGIIFQQLLRGNRLGPVVLAIHTLDDAIAFRQRPML
jgi:hypothetical protein